ncbi:MAG: hypothetical protein OSB14_10495 [Planctomycetota bacterium]|nr:hypothetical protein [Planctomycetota bacterium]
MRSPLLRLTLAFIAISAPAYAQQSASPGKIAPATKVTKKTKANQALPLPSLIATRNLSSPTLNLMVGGSDDCNTPDVISGVGTFAFDQTLATTGLDGQTEYLCYQFGSSVIDSDVWFEWTAATTDTFFIETCNFTTTDTKLALYPSGACPTASTSLACNDDSCALQSQLSISATAGTSYLLQVGTFPGAVAGVGSFNIYPAVSSSNDDCSTPDTISGTGTFAFNNQTATTSAEGQNEYNCYAFGSSAVDHDVWFAWTAPSNDTFQIETCNLTSTDTKIGVYPGSACPTAGSSIICNDDACALQSQLLFPGTTGSTYLIQLGTFPGAAGGTGSFNVDIFVPATNDDCVNPIAISGEGSFAFDQSTATTGTEGQYEALCTGNGGTFIDFDVWFAWTSDFTGSARLSTCTGNQIDSKVAVYPGSACPAGNTSLACNDDVVCPACPTYAYSSQLEWSVTTGNTYMIQVGTWPASMTAGAGDFTIEQAFCDPACSTCIPGTIYCRGDGSGSATCPCGNHSTNDGGCANGSGQGGLLSADGAANVSADSVILRATNLLPGQPCLFFQGNNAINSGDGVTFGDGLRCAGGAVIRLEVSFPDSNGNAETSSSIAAKGACTAGDVKRYQSWYRDPQSSPCGSSFNLTNGYEITWEI